MAWEAADTFHRLHCVQLCSSDPVSTKTHIRGLALALTALNLSRSSLSRPSGQAEIYLMLAIRLKLSWPRPLSPALSRYPSLEILIETLPLLFLYSGNVTIKPAGSAPITLWAANSPGSVANRARTSF